MKLTRKRLTAVVVDSIVDAHVAYNRVDLIPDHHVSGRCMKRPLISHRACHLAGVKSEDLNRIVEEIKSFVEAEIPEKYTVNVYKDQVTCCGHLPIGVAVEIEGPEEQPIKNLDEKIYGKIKEICGREHIPYHECSPIEILKL